MTNSIKIKTTVIVETMPEHLRSSHRAAGNWGVYPLNGAERNRVSLDEAEEIVEADEDGYDHIIDGTESEGPSIADVATALSHIVEIHIDDSDGAHVTDYAPDSTDEEYGGDTEPGSAWDEECDRLLAEIREELPEGWQWLAR